MPFVTSDGLCCDPGAQLGAKALDCEESLKETNNLFRLFVPCHDFHHLIPEQSMSRLFVCTVLQFVANNYYATA